MFVNSTLSNPLVEVLLQFHHHLQSVADDRYTEARVRLAALRSVHLPSQALRSRIHSERNSGIWSVSVQCGPPLAFPLPRQRTMGGRFVKDHKITCFQWDLMYYISVSFPGQDVFGAFEIRLVAARYHTEPSVSRIRVGKVKLAYDQAAPHSAVLIGVEPGAIESGAIVKSGVWPLDHAAT